MSDEIKPILARVADGHSLTAEDSEMAFNIIMAGETTDSQMGAFLMALRLRGESVEEITGAVRAMRAKMLTVSAPADAMDIVGTGGDGLGTFNISTGAAFVVAGAGVPVAKHGNRAVTSKSGAADVLTSLGVNLECSVALIEKSIAEAGIGFMPAPRHHSAMKYVMPVRQSLGIRTIFNNLGPLSNPAGVKRQFTGAFDRAWIEPMAEVLGILGSDVAWVVNAAEGMDEMSTTGVTYVAALENGTVRTFEVTPEDAGLPRASLDDLKGGDGAYNAAAINALVDGEAGPYRDIVLMNAAASLIIADKADDLKAGVALAAAAIDDGKARAALDKLIEISNSGS
ncbi:MAG: anthranilate phosphoribosyltransferase [Rhodospirillaceae bacterium]|jgi:anthranilate phosphoribosyltransferase|nr:anthranilate phosphoribosyltransferase [Rhodospirillaceae bacterium]